jgi:hypothetical protein
MFCRRSHRSALCLQARLNALSREMCHMNLETLSIEDLADLRDKVTIALPDTVAARQKELSAESERVGALVTSKPSTVRPKRPVKYRDGENELGWGLKPAWAKAKADTLESFGV